MIKSYFGAGCFWGVEARFKEQEGVLDTTVGYGGGEESHPTYEQVCDGTTQHVELVEVVFDEKVLSFEELVRLFFSLHNPTTKNRQGLDVGHQYRSVIYTTEESQGPVAEKVKSELDNSGQWENPIVTTIEPFKNFYPAEDYHQDYFDKNPGHCHI